MQGWDKLAHDSASGKFGTEDKGHIVLMRKAFIPNDKDVEELLKYAENIPPTPNPMNRNQNLLRRQITLGKGYDFGQGVQQEKAPPEDWPTAVSDFLQWVRDLGYPHNGIHMNYYPDGKAGIAPHKDDEAAMVAGAPIFSLTLLVGTQLPRNFQVYDDAKHQVAEVALGHGDVVVMGGSMQKHMFHGVKPTTRRAFREAGRINLTARAFTSSSLSKRSRGDEHSEDSRKKRQVKS